MLGDPFAERPGNGLDIRAYFEALRVQGNRLRLTGDLL